MNSHVGFTPSNQFQLDDEAKTFKPETRNALTLIQMHAAAASRRLTERHKQEASVPQFMFLPGMDDLMHAMPNLVAISSLFAPIARGKKHFHNETVLVCHQNATITYTGIQLDETQADVWMQLVYEARNTALGEAVTLYRAALLRAIGRGTSGRHYSWLHQTIHAFTAATISLEVRKPNGEVKYSIGHVKAFHMLADFDYNPDKEQYSYTIDPRWKRVFDGREYSLIDLEKRRKIGRGQDMAKALQRLVATSSDLVQRYGLKWLKEKLQYSGRMYDFKRALEYALAELVRVEIIAAGKIGLSTRGKEQIVLTRL